MWSCKFCGSQNPGNAVFCTGCGKPASEAASPEENPPMNQKANWNPPAEAPRLDPAGAVHPAAAPTGKKRKWWVWALGAVLLLAAAAAVCFFTIHSWEPATCTVPSTCKICGKTQGTAPGHAFSDATCTEPRICARCGATEGEPLGHDWGEWTVTVPAGCETEGTEQRVCKHDGSHVETRSIAATGHDWGAWTVTLQPGCDTQGTEKRVCKHDGSHVETRSIAATGHDWGEWFVATEPTCTQAGVEKRVCRNKSSHTETRPIAALGHDWTEATYSAPSTCTRCGAQTGHVKGYVGELSGYWGDPVNLHGYTHFYAFELYENVENCLAISIQIEIDQVTGNPFGGWYLFGRDLNGKWQNIGQFELVRDNLGTICTYQVSLKGTPSFSALTVSPIYDNQWTIGYFDCYFVEVQKYVD
jgi:hypothetical protein